MRKYIKIYENSYYKLKEEREKRELFFIIQLEWKHEDKSLPEDEKKSNPASILLPYNTQQHGHRYYAWEFVHARTEKKVKIQCCIDLSRRI